MSELDLNRATARADTGAGPVLSVSHLKKSYETRRGTTEAVGDLTFDIAQGEFVCIVGSSGCGKTTLLKCMCGLLPASSGSVAISGRRVTEPPRETALVFQEYGRSLFPWLTVRKNIGFALKSGSNGREHTRVLVHEAMDAVGLSNFGDHFPWQLSGGMQQRVAIARALAYQPKILLMDEPFASVDAQTRADLEDLILRVKNQFGITVVFVTHDIDESVYLADRVIALTRAPTSVKETLVIDLPAERDQVTTKALPRFAELRSHVYETIRGRAHPPVD